MSNWVEIDGLRLAAVLRAGIYRLYLHTDHINNINVFPVPDGDTGTNMSMTMGAVLTALERSPSTHAGQTLTHIADAALDGARGNSGAILAQFLLGLADRAGDLVVLTKTSFAEAVAQGARYARDAVCEPRQGTLLSLLAEFSAQITCLSADATVSGFDVLFSRAMQTVRSALASTRDQLEALRCANVVDAGALGFVEMLEGITSYLATGEVVQVSLPTHEADEPMAVADTNAEYQYCVECLVNGEAIELRQLKEQLAPLGNSLVTGGTQKKVRVHIHTNQPQQVFTLAAGFGEVSGQKADDIIRQQHASQHSRRQRVAVVTDSAADIPDAKLDELDIQMIPLRVHFGERSYLDKVTLSPVQFYHELVTNPQHPKTSQPPPGDFRRSFEFLASHFAAVVCIDVTAKVSGTFASAASAAARVDPARVSVIDSLNASLGQGLIVMSAAETALRGGNVADVIGAARQAIRTTKTFALVSRLDYAVRGGRVSRFVKLCADTLRFAPILTNHADGRIAPGGLILGRLRLQQRFARWVHRRMQADLRYRILIGHGDCEAQGQALLQDIRGLHANIESIELTPLGTALGVHGGPGLLVVALQPCAAD